jgi:hypothetical protein
MMSHAARGSHADVHGRGLFLLRGNVRGCRPHDHSLQPPSHPPAAGLATSRTNLRISCSSTSCRRYARSAGVPFRTCRPEEEEQATNFGGTLLLPRGLRRLNKTPPAVNRARRVRRRMGTAPYGGGQRTRRQKPNSLATERRRCERSPCSLPLLSTMPARRLIRTAGLAGRLSRRLWACRSRTSGHLGRVRVPWRRLGTARSRWRGSCRGR